MPGVQPWICRVPGMEVEPNKESKSESILATASATRPNWEFLWVEVLIVTKGHRLQGKHNFLAAAIGSMSLLNRAEEVSVPSRAVELQASL